MFIHVEHRMFQELSFFLSNTIYYFWSTINPLHPDSSMQILHTVLNTFPYMLAGRICLTIKRFFSLPLFLYSHNLNVGLRGDIERGN